MTLLDFWLELHNSHDATNIREWERSKSIGMAITLVANMPATCPTIRTIQKRTNGSFVVFESRLRSFQGKKNECFVKSL